MTSDITARYDFLGLYDENSQYQYGSYSQSLQGYGFFNCRERPPVNRASQVTLRNVEPSGT